MGNTIQHPCHPHPMRQLDWAPGSSYSFDCDLCNQKLKDSAYGCLPCQFSIHKRCAEAPSLIENHPFHPQHPLALSHGIRKAFVCDACHIRPRSASAYTCEGCNFDLDLACALSNLPRKEENKEDREEEEVPKVQYFDHEHPLTWFFAKSEIGSKCSVCEEEIQGEACCCLACMFFLHRRCFELTRTSAENKDELPLEKAEEKNVLPEAIEHPFHPQHPLSLFISRSPGVKCDACKVDCRIASDDSSKKDELYLFYGCDQCRFCLDIKCASAVVQPTDATVKIPYISHEHQLSHFFAKVQTYISCGVCTKRILGELFGCLNCFIFFHKNCVVAPETFDYSLHPEHRLALRTFTARPSFGGIPLCPSCTRPLHNQVVYGCECGFTIHTECALRTHAYHEDGNSAEIELSWHEHPVRLCHRMNWPRESCSACGEYIQGLCYVCLVGKCRLFLHKSCAGLTSEIQHPHHPNHALSLIPSASRKQYKCEACREEIGGFCFSCSKCPFYLDTKCASITPDRKHVLHEHKLTCFQKIPSLKCNVCGETCNSDFYRCVACDFNIHLQCMELPKTVKPRAHMHTMVLYDFYIDDDSGEYYCDFCEKRRNPDLGVYLCEECKLQSKLVAHIECALSKSVLLKNDGIAEKVDVRIESLQREVDEAKANYEALLKELEEAKKERPILPY